MHLAIPIHSRDCAAFAYFRALWFVFISGKAMIICGDANCVFT